MSRFLFALWQGGGNVPPQLAVARRLVDRGHSVRVLAPRCVEPQVAAAGADFVPYRKAPEHDPAVPELDLVADWKTSSPLKSSARTRDVVLYDMALPIARDLLAEIDASGADAIVTDFMLLGGYLAAEKAGVPVAALVHTVCLLPAPGLPPPGLGLKPAAGPLGRLRDRALWYVAGRFYDAGLDGVNDARRTLGLPPVRSVFDLMTNARRVLVLTSPAFDFPARLPANMRYVGAPGSAPAVEPWTPPGTPLVLVSLSTTYQAQGDLLRRIADALQTLPVHALITTGPSIDPGTLPSGPRLTVQRWAPHAAVIPHCALVVTHAGHGTVTAALSRGVPLVCVPMGRDQADVAARVTWRGAGLKVSSRASAGTFRTAIARVLEEPGFRAAARRIADGMAADDGGLAAQEIETLATARQDFSAGAGFKPREQVGHNH